MAGRKRIEPLKERSHQNNSNNNLVVETDKASERMNSMLKDMRAVNEVPVGSINYRFRKVLMQ